jgi:limonene-1,2-epoxide hydrolase
LVSAEQMAQTFWFSLRRHDVGRAGALLAEDALFEPAGMPASRGKESLDAYLVATHDEIGAHLTTIAHYDDILITERIGRVVGEPARRRHVILSLIQVHGDRITSWQDFFDSAAGALPDVSSAPDMPRAASRVA